MGDALPPRLVSGEVKPETKKEGTIMSYSNLIDDQIWPGYEARGFQHPTKNVVSVKYSPRAGGPYEITRVAILLLSNASVKERALLTTILLDQREQGIECPVVDSDLLEKAKTRPPIPVDQRAERLLRFISGQAENLASIVSIRQDAYGAYAWSESTEWKDIVYLLNYLEEMEWIQGERSGEGWFFGQPTVAGHERIAEQRAKLDSSQVFVAMWFAESMNQAYEAGIEPAIKEAGYKPLRIDRKEHVNKIDDEIIAELRRSRFLVADFTHGDEGARGGVYYEAGFAHGLDLPVIFTCKEDARKKLHFDTEHYNHIFWTTPEELREKLKTRILAVIGEGPENQRIP